MINVTSAGREPMRKLILTECVRQGLTGTTFQKRMAVEALNQIQEEIGGKLRKNAPSQSGFGAYIQPQVEIQDPGGHVSAGAEKLKVLERELAGLQGLLDAGSPAEDLTVVQAKITNLQQRIGIHRALGAPKFGRI